MAKIPLVATITVVIVAASGLAAYLNYSSQIGSRPASLAKPEAAIVADKLPGQPSSSETSFRSQEQAIANYSSAIKLNAADDKALLDRASCYYSTSSYQSAMADYQTIMALKKSTYQNQAMLGQALCNYSLGQYGLAIHQCRELLKVKPKYLKAIEVLANCQLRQGSYLDAIDTYTSGLRLDHDAGDLYFGRSSAYFKNQMPEKALADLVKATGCNPSNIEYHLKCATVAQVLGKKDLVKAEAESVLKLSKDNKEAIALLQSVN